MGAGLDGFFFKDTPSLKRELNLTVKYVTFNHSNMSSNLIALKYLSRYKNYNFIYIYFMRLNNKLVIFLTQNRNIYLLHTTLII